MSDPVHLDYNAATPLAPQVLDVPAIVGLGAAATLARERCPRPRGACAHSATGCSRQRAPNWRGAAIPSIGYRTR